MHISDITLHNGTWQAVLSDCANQPDVVAMIHNDKPHDVVVSHLGNDMWQLRGDLPTSVLSDGVHVCRIKLRDGTDLGQFSMILGNAAQVDMRAELELLRAELALLKKAFRSHVRETM